MGREIFEDFQTGGPTISFQRVPSQARDNTFTSVKILR